MIKKIEEGLIALFFLVGIKKKKGRSSQTVLTYFMNFTLLT